MHERILLVEDDSNLGTQIATQLRDEGYTAVWTQDGSDALREDFDSFGLVILDLMLPGAYGMDILKVIRRTTDVPVLMLSARNATNEKVRALRLGADDYMTKPFWPEELLARVHARLRRPNLHHAETLRIGGLHVDMRSGQATSDGRPVLLTKVESSILIALLRRRGDAVTRVWLADTILSPEGGGGERTLDVHISRLRKKLGSHGRMIKTVWRTGYRFEQGAPA